MKKLKHLIEIFRATRRRTFRVVNLDDGGTIEEGMGWAESMLITIKSLFRFFTKTVWK